MSSARIVPHTVPPQKDLPTRKRLLRHGPGSMDFKWSQKECRAVAASVQTTRCFTQVSGALRVVAVKAKVSTAVRSVRNNRVNSWRKRSRIGMLFLKLVPSCLHLTLRSTPSLIVGIESDLRRHDEPLNRVMTFTESYAVKRDKNKTLPASNKRPRGKTS